ncbi:MAG: hypothetical protein U0838_02630 [Chloroflexota bacterium]
MRYTAFFLAVAAGVGELAGSMMGLGMAGVGFAFGGGGLIDPSTVVGIAIVMAIGSIFAGVAVMMARDPRPYGAFVGMCAVGAAVAGGPWSAVAATLGLASALLTLRVDRATMGV